MYHLNSSDINNSDVISVAEDNKEKFLDIASMNKISYIIFNEKIDSSLFRKLKIFLTLADEFKIPISKNVADVLFFAACVNSNDKVELTIKNLSQAKTLFDLYENDFKKIQPEENDIRVRFTELKTDHNVLFPGTFVVWKIPVGFFRADGKQSVTLSGSAFCLLDINGEEYKVPRVLFIKFFKESLVKGRLICSSTEEIKEAFNIDDRETLNEVFNYIGLSLRPELKNIQLPLGQYVVNDNKIFCYTKEKVNEYWTLVRDNQYVLLPRLHYVALKTSNMETVNIIA